MKMLWIHHWKRSVTTLMVRVICSRRCGLIKMTFSILITLTESSGELPNKDQGGPESKENLEKCHLKWQLIKTYCSVFCLASETLCFCTLKPWWWRSIAPSPWCSQNGDYHGALLNLEPPTATAFWHLYQLCLFKDEDRKIPSSEKKQQQSSCWETNIESPKGEGRSHQQAGKYREHNMSNRQGASRKWQNPSIYRIAALFCGRINKLVLERKKTTFSFKAKDKQYRQ